jgi:predicted TIM-barrel fold metal-dependent hydrolase
MEKEYYVIDMHCHVADSSLPDKIGKSGSDNLHVQKVYESFEKLQKHVGWYGGILGLDGTPENYINIMERTGTDLSVFAMLGFKEELGGIELSSSEFLEKVIAEYPKDKYLAYAGVDPRLPEKEKEEKIEYYIKKAGFIGIKINPNDWGTFPLNDPKTLSIYKKCEELGVPVHVHTGLDPTGRISYGNPMLLEEIVLKYPNLKLILEHYGFPWKYEAYSMCRKYDNVYLTLAWHFNDLVHHNKFLAWQELEEMRIHADIDKIMYGSDFPASPNQKEVIDFLKFEKVPWLLRMSGFPQWSYEMRAKILGLNAASLLGVKNEKIERIKAKFKRKEERLLSMTWSVDAQGLLESIPGFIRKSAVKKIEFYAKEHKIKVITPEVMKKARNK